MDRNQEGAVCPNCEEQNIVSLMKFLYISLEEMVLKCESPNCLFPFDNFKFKSVKDGSISTYQSSPQETNEQTLKSPNKTEYSLPEDLDSSTDNRDPSNEIFDFDLSFFTDNHSLEIESYTQCDNTSGITKEQQLSLSDFSTLNFEEFDTFDVAKGPERIEQSSNTNVCSLDGILDALCASFESEPQFPMSPNKNVNVVSRKESNVKVEVDKRPAIEIHSIEILPQPVIANQSEPVVNENKVESQSESQTISNYLDMIKAKHKKVKTSKKKTKVKSEKEEVPITIYDKINLKSNSSSRPLDILKSMESFK